MSRWPTTTPAERFWAKVDKSGECWIWTGAIFSQHRNRQPYGHFRTANRDWSAHRFAWTIDNGDIPDGLQVNHHCDTALCVKPDHLYLGTQKQNVADMDRRGRRPRPVMDLAKQLMEEWGVSQTTVFVRLRDMRANGEAY